MLDETATFEHFDLDDIGHVHACGKPENPLVVLLHGFMQTGDSWRTIAEVLKTDHWVLAPDLLGHGSTPFSPGDDLSLEAYVDQLRRLFEWAENQRSSGVTHPVSLVGYSLGGRIAALFATQFPDKIDLLVLESAGLGPQTEEERQARIEKAQTMVARLDESVARDPEAPLAAFIDYWENLPLFASQRELPEETQERIRAERLANCPEALRANLSDAGQDKMPDVRPALANLNKPVLYLVGEKDAGYTKIARSLMRAWAESHDEMRLLNKGFVQVSVIPQAGHNIHLERPEEYSLLISKFLQRTQ
ncbi:alpha/beta fold hydrolase [Anaerotardibacter muris]|uniref:alpha/beta fold hydrolase n=1 Tax=Anaerotardibacter muris TaxID=2941505 RepID=UPI00203A7EFC|nr:alpha/beta fold hydrolase [Anaerotardibacter muris]